MENKKRPGIAAIVLAIILLVSGTGFGILQIANGVRAYWNTSSEDQIHRMEDYLHLMENLEEILDTSSLESEDVDPYLDSKLQNYDLTGSQEKEIRKLYKEILEKAEGSHVDRELAANSLTREIIYYRQTIPNPEQGSRYMMNTLLIGIGSILLSLVIFIVLIKKRH